MRVAFSLFVLVSGCTYVTIPPAPASETPTVERITSPSTSSGVDMDAGFIIRDAQSSPSPVGTDAQSSPEASLPPAPFTPDASSLADATPAPDAALPSSGVDASVPPPPVPDAALPVDGAPPGPTGVHCTFTWIGSECRGPAPLGTQWTVDEDETTYFSGTSLCLHGKGLSDYMASPGDVCLPLENGQFTYELVAPELHQVADKDGNLLDVYGGDNIHISHLNPCYQTAAHCVGTIPAP